VLTRRAAIIGGRFSPRDLFAGQIAGAWFDPSDLSTMFQSGSRASPGTPVSAVNDPVGLILDKSGNQLDLSQATSTKRPTYQVDGNGFGYLQGDGVDDFLFSSTTVSGNNQTVCSGVQCGTGTTMTYVCTVGSTDRIGFRSSGVGTNTVQFIFHDGTIATPKSGNDPSGPLVAFGTYDKVTPATTCRVNAANSTGTGSTTPNATVGTALLAQTNGGSVFNGKFYGLVHVARALSNAERQRVERWLAAKCGVSL
jgi:hypothetical protein